MKNKKTILIVVVVILILALFVGLFSIDGTPTATTSEEEDTYAGPVGSLDGDTLTSTGVTLVIENITDLEYGFTKSYTIYSIDDNYNELDKINEIEEDELESYYASEDGTLELELDWTDVYGELPAGYYLLVYNTVDYLFEFAFTIE